MHPDPRKLQVLLVVVTLSVPCGLAQKVNVGYDKSADFSRYRSYTLQEPPTPPNRPVLYASVVGTIQKELEAKGLVSKEQGGDLSLIAEGSVDYGLSSAAGATADTSRNSQKPQVDVQLWAGFKPPEGSAGKGLPNGALELTMVDPTTKKVVWSGIVVQKLNPEKKQQSLERIAAAINKLLAEFPPKR